MYSDQTLIIYLDLYKMNTTPRQPQTPSKFRKFSASNSDILFDPTFKAVSQAPTALDDSMDHYQKHSMISTPK